MSNKKILNDTNSFILKNYKILRTKNLTLSQIFSIVFPYLYVFRMFFLKREKLYTVFIYI